MLNSPHQVPRQPSAFRAPWSIFWTALLVRVLYMTLAHTYRFPSVEDHFKFGFEMARIARSMVMGHGYANPFMRPTGVPSAWNPPLYPLAIAAAFKVFGIYTLKSAWAMLALNSVFSAATVPAIYEIAARCYARTGKGRGIALWSAWLWALYPAAMQYAVRWIWDISLATMLLTWALVMALRLAGIGDDSEEEQRRTTLYWVLFGLLWGLIALSNSTLLLFLPVCGIWILIRAANKAAAIRGAILAGMVCIACITPWMWRNWRVFHAFIPLRGNFGAEFWVGNGPGSNGFQWGLTVASAADLRHYSEVGEVAYVREHGAMARAYIKDHPGHFAKLTLQRFYMFWMGIPHAMDNKPWGEGLRAVNYCLLTVTGLMGLALSIRNRIPASGMIAWAFVLCPLLYYFVVVEVRFRHPLEPLIAIFTVYLFQSAKPRHLLRGSDFATKDNPL
jgi:hypothetical protein